MDIKKVTGVYFSPAGSTKTVVETTVDELARLFKAECRYISLNTPSDRAQEYQFAPDELVVFGCPVYAGRLPNKISPDFARCLHGEGEHDFNDLGRFVDFGLHNYPSYRCIVPNSIQVYTASLL